MELSEVLDGNVAPGAGGQAIGAGDMLHVAQAVNRCPDAQARRRRQRSQAAS